MPVIQIQLPRGLNSKLFHLVSSAHCRADGRAHGRTHAGAEQVPRRRQPVVPQGTCRDRRGRLRLRPCVPRRFYPRQLGLRERARVLHERLVVHRPGRQHSECRPDYNNYYYCESPLVSTNLRHIYR